MPKRKSVELEGRPLMISLSLGLPPGANRSGRSVAWYARLLGVQEVVSSNLTAPTIFKDCKLTALTAGRALTVLAILLCKASHETPAPASPDIAPPSAGSRLPVGRRRHSPRCPRRGPVRCSPGAPSAGDQLQPAPPRR